MPSVSNVSLLIADGSTADTMKVTVKGTLGFDAGEVGKSFRLEIQLYGEDRSGDRMPSDDPAGDDKLYTFLWPSSFLSVPFRKLTVASAGSQSFSEVRQVKVERLDEDSGMEYMGQADINTPIYMPRKDEVYARVTLSTTPVTARSSTVTIGAGV